MGESENKIANPLNHYKKPSDVAHDRNLSLDEKIEVLKNWMNDIELQEIADEENMLATYQKTREDVDSLRRLLTTYRTHQSHVKKTHH